MLPALLLVSSLLAPEIEVQAGALRGTKAADPWAPVIGVRASANVGDMVAMGLLANLAFRDPVFRGADSSGVHAWDALAELRLHSTGPLRVHLAGAAGVGQITTWQCDCNQSLFPLHGSVAFTWQASAGLRYLAADGASVGIEFSLTHWKGLRHADFEYTGQSRPAPFDAVLILLAAGFR